MNSGIWLERELVRLVPRFWRKPGDKPGDASARPFRFDVGQEVKRKGSSKVYRIISRCREKSTGFYYPASGEVDVSEGWCINGYFIDRYEAAVSEYELEPVKEIG